ncbi:MAG TPA: hypothetical protein VMT18_06635 [Planctomycetota bacterium]|nr:hypothetical protein [Planctomycetota bacterium]
MLAVALSLALLTQAVDPDGIRRPAPPESHAVTPVQDFELLDVDGRPFRLSEACGEGWVLLVFVRGMW